jgi:mRNA-degrading endonuclease RelE of RelBE toxin-antitoxin system
MRDQVGMREITAAVASLADDPYPAAGFHRGRYHRLRIGQYRILYVVDGDVITVERVDRVIG